jgi:acetyl esterase/lipase
MNEVSGCRGSYRALNWKKVFWSFFAKKDCLLLLLAQTGCSAAGLLNATVPKGGVEITRGVSYGPADREKLDIYRPNTATDAPVVVFFYGGAWNSGSRSMYPFVAATMARRGTIVVVPDYRLYPEVHYPVFLADCARAVAWTGAHLAGLGGDGRKLFLMGHSAGAYNAAMLALDPEYLAAAGFDRAGIAGFIGLAGPYDFVPMTGANTKLVFSGAVDKPATQPITYVDGHAPPMLLLAGSDDETVRPRNSRALAAKTRQAGGEATLKIYPGLGHIGLVTAIAPVFQWRAPVLNDVERFIASHELKREAP